MKKLHITTVLLLLLALGNSAQAQLKRANRHFDNLAYARAIHLYEKSLKKEAGDREVMARLADCYRLTSDTKNAESWYQKVTKNRKSDPINCFYYGQALMNNRKWEEAGKWFEKYLEKNPGDALATEALWSSQNYREFVKDSSLYTVVPTNLNTAEADFAPSFYMRRALVFSSARNPSRLEFGWTKKSFLDLYTADLAGRRQDLGAPRRLAGHANSKLHEGGQTFSNDGNVMFFSRNNFHRGKVGRSMEGVIRLKTYRAELQKGKWKKVKGIPFNNDEYSVGHPSLSLDGKTLYFVSDMPGGLGGTDLYKVAVNLETQEWGEPINLGAKINTPGNEMFPWVSTSGVLYFASDGHAGLGGLDIFQVEDAMGDQVKNMGYPINSAQDDFSLIVDERNGQGYFSSNRTGGMGDDDIYMFRRKQVLKGVVADAGSGEKLEGVRVELHSLRGFEHLVYTGEDGDFRQGLDPNGEYILMVSREGYEPTKKVVSARDIDPATGIGMVLTLNKLPPCPDVVDPGVGSDPVALPGNTGTPVTPPAVDSLAGTGADTTAEKPLWEEGKTMEEGMVFYIIYYNFDKHNIRSEDARPELDRLVNFMKTYPDVKVEMSSHTDARGSDSYNMRLSTNRAREAFDYIVSHGVEAGRLNWVPKGETELTNDCGNGVNCSDAQHQMNRRTEFRFNGRYIKREN